MIKKNCFRLFLFLTVLFTASACVDYSNSSSLVGTRGQIDDVPHYDRFIGSIYFHTASSALSNSAIKDIKRIARTLNDRRYEKSRVVISGYADKKRGVEENTELAAERAQRVALTLEAQGLDLERLIIDSRDSRFARSKAAGRRVDIYIDYNSVGAYRNDFLYPILVGFFLLVTFAVALVVFRRRSR
ncbi:MAG TPA: OmpA family protein [Turneriella sp.]|nr:OmpA family protein [Turneriella sp.]